MILTTDQQSQIKDLIIKRLANDFNEEGLFETVYPTLGLTLDQVIRYLKAKL